MVIIKNNEGQMRKIQQGSQYQQNHSNANDMTMYDAK